MNSFKHPFLAIALLVTTAAAPASAASKLDVHDAWIRSAPPNAIMLAGYANLRNTGDAPITIRAVKADGFGDTSLHETVIVGDVSQMRPLTELTIAPGASVTFAPVGKHIMLMQPTSPTNPGSRVAMTFTFADGGQQTADFVVRDAAAGAEDTVPATHQH